MYYGSGAAPQWTPLTNGDPTTGLPYVRATALDINYMVDTLRVATYGRGLWETPLRPCLAKSTGPGAMIGDRAEDVGNEPDDEAGQVLWASPEIWVRNAPDTRFTGPSFPPRFSHEHEHENPEYSATPVNTPWVYAMVRNTGDQPVSGVVHLYWANASTGLAWQTPDWKEIPTASTATVTALQPGGAWVVDLQWTDIPAPALSTNGHFCLLARFVADTSTPDPIINEAFGNVIWDNVHNSNNIAWKNVTVVDLVNNLQDGGGDVIVKSLAPRASGTTTRLGFEVPVEQRGSSVFDHARVEVRLDDALLRAWVRGGKRGEGVRESPDGAALLVERPSAWIGGLSLATREAHTVRVQFHATRPTPTSASPLALDLVQYEESRGGAGRPRVVGGERYEVTIGGTVAGTPTPTPMPTPVR